LNAIEPSLFASEVEFVVSKCGDIGFHGVVFPLIEPDSDGDNDVNDINMGNIVFLAVDKQGIDQTRKQTPTSIMISITPQAPAKDIPHLQPHPPFPQRHFTASNTSILCKITTAAITFYHRNHAW